LECGNSLLLFFAAAVRYVDPALKAARKSRSAASQSGNELPHSKFDASCDSGLHGKDSEVYWWLAILQMHNN
jgi:hypothetical protein